MKRKKKFTTILIIIGAVIGAFVLFNSLGGEVSKSSGLDKEINRLQEEVDKLENRNSDLVDLTKELSDLEFLENEARVKMGLKLPGESVMVINRATSTLHASVIEEQRNRRTEEQSVWDNPRRWMRYFFNKR